jgi:hypothetical protein
VPILPKCFGKKLSAILGLSCINFLFFAKKIPFCPNLPDICKVLKLRTPLSDSIYKFSIQFIKATSKDSPLPFNEGATSGATLTLKTTEPFGEKHLSQLSYINIDLRRKRLFGVFKGSTNIYISNPLKIHPSIDNNIRRIDLIDHIE